MDFVYFLQYRVIFKLLLHVYSICIHKKGGKCFPPFFICIVVLDSLFIFREPTIVRGGY